MINKFLSNITLGIIGKKVKSGQRWLLEGESDLENCYNIIRVYGNNVFYKVCCSDIEYRIDKNILRWLFNYIDDKGIKE